jgi:hypothetical protein
MQETSVSALNAWDSFYVIIGSSAAALTGLMFVVVTLLPEARRRLPANDEGISAFATPTVLHFCAALLVSAMLSAPWRSLGWAGAAIATTGAGGLVYAVIVTRRVRSQKAYRPVFEDWLWHVLLPFVAYVMLVIAGSMLRNDATDALFNIGAATLLLLFIGIHNAWDTVTYLALGHADDEAPKK